jgi:hypothetical protein
VSITVNIFFEGTGRWLGGIELAKLIVFAPVVFVDGVLHLLMAKPYLFSIEELYSG